MAIGPRQIGAGVLAIAAVGVVAAVLMTRGPSPSGSTAAGSPRPSGRPPASPSATRSPTPPPLSTGLQFGVWIGWVDNYDGVDDNVEFFGRIDKVEPAADSRTLFLTGTGAATGSRNGWVACNPGLDEQLSGFQIPSFLSAEVRDGTVTFAAYARGELEGVTAEGFRVPLASIPFLPPSASSLAEALGIGEEHAPMPLTWILPGPPIGEPCPHTSSGSLNAFRLDQP